MGLAIGEGDWAEIATLFIIFGHGQGRTIVTHCQDAVRHEHLAMYRHGWQCPG